MGLAYVAGWVRKTKLSGLSAWRTLVTVGGLVALLTGCMAPQASVQLTTTPETSPPGRSSLRVLWVNSYSLDNAWSLQVRIGILDALSRLGYQYSDNSLVWEIYNLDSTNAVSAGGLRAKADRAIAAIQTFEPDVVIISDNEAAEVVIPRYPDSEMKFVLCGVHPEVERRGLLQENVIVVVEQVYPEQTVAMVEALVTESEGTYLIVGDNSVTGQVHTRLAYDALLRLQYERGGAPPILGIAEDWAAWQDLISGAPEDVDFVLIANYMPLPGVLDAAGDLPAVGSGDGLSLVSEVDMMRWTIGHTPAPIFALTGSLVSYGAVGGLVTNGYEQGYLAAEMAVRFVTDAGAIEQQVVVAPNRLTLNAAAARYWDLPIPILFPIAAEVYEYFPSVEGGL